MKKFLWYLKVAVLCAAMFVLSGGYASGVIAQDEGIGIEGGICFAQAQACSQSTSNQCFCPDGEYTRGCTGCFIPNGGSGCGTCR
jgi:hypothetical protein